MSDSGTDEKATGRHAWALFPGEVPPPEVVAGFRALRSLPTSAVRNFWLLLAPVLEQADEATSRQVIESFCQRFEVNPANVLAAVRACDLVFHRAAALDVGEAAFRADLEALSPEQPVQAEILMPRFAEVKARLQARLLEDTLADHGNVLTGFDWRLDRLQTSSRGNMGDTSILYLNLQYRHGKKEKQLSLQLGPAAIEGLRRFWDQFTKE